MSKSLQDALRKACRLATLWLATLTGLCAALDGVTYQHLSLDGPLSVHVLEIDPAQCRLEIVSATDRALGRSTVLEIATQSRAVAAINGGFFEMGGAYDGLPRGALRIGGMWLAPALRPRGAVGWGDGGRWALFDRLLTWQEVRVGTRTVALTTFNMPCIPQGAVAFTPAFGSATPPLRSGIQLIEKGGVVAGKERSERSVIPTGGFVVSVAGDNPLFRWWERVPLRMPFALCISPIPQLCTFGRLHWERAPNILAGTPLLLLDGRIICDYDAEGLNYPAFFDLNPRTAIGMRASGTWVFVVVDGRQPGRSIGMTLDALAKLMQSLGCTSALNLDGGGSSTMVLEGKVVNDPSEGIQRPVSNAIVITER